jgi:hypothetical protein
MARKLAEATAQAPAPKPAPPRDWINPDVAALVAAFFYRERNT